MTDKAADQSWEAGKAIIGVVVSVLLTLGAATLIAGGYKEKVDQSLKEIEQLKSNSATKEDVHRIEGGIIRIETDVKKILESNNNQRRR